MLCIKEFKDNELQSNLAATLIWKAGERLSEKVHWGDAWIFEIQPQENEKETAF